MLVCYTKTQITLSLEATGLMRLDLMLLKTDDNQINTAQPDSIRSKGALTFSVVQRIF